MESCHRTSEVGLLAVPGEDFAVVAENRLATGFFRRDPIDLAHPGVGMFFPTEWASMLIERAIGNGKGRDGMRGEDGHEFGGIFQEVVP